MDGVREKLAWVRKNRNGWKGRENGSEGGVMGEEGLESLRKVIGQAEMLEGSQQ